ncbi:SRPBCC family protein [Ovoidimarina sediminis]|uniref:SRPBCC family protein n=1 Tax=Ovoidimarina sediminis TaxID=3079856 RepID=UPI0029131F50|nr:SRPBCC domain-containing protein [Rhodophyticola sp. MJ-SS7]MDU8943474.1 SRPBCC domain-containing protein [Rhodophyticola sp. MJ-SS7]
MTDDSGDWVRITRSFAAPIETVWRTWTEPALFRQWYGPKGFTVPVAEMDLRVGGTRRICMEMQAPDRVMRMWFTGVYTEITAPRRLVYTEAMCEEDGTLIDPQSMGMPEGTPAFTEVTVDLAEAGEGTEMTMIHKGVPAGSPGEGGWNAAFDNLAEALAGG